MTTAVQRRRGTTTEHASFTGLEGEISVNTTKDTLVVHDGSTAGGFELARADGSNFVATSVDINGGTIDGTTIGASSVSSGAFTTLTASGEITANGGIALGDNDKATFGAGDDLQIYHTATGNHSIIEEIGGGSLVVRTNGPHIEFDKGSSEYMARMLVDGAVELYYDSALKLATTATGIDVTGNVESDSVTIGVGAVAGTEKLRVNGTVLTLGGTVAIPAIGIGDVNTGIYAPTAGTLGWTVNGTQRLLLNSTGIDVTGTATMDGLDVRTTSSPARIKVQRDDNTNSVDSASIDLLEGTGINADFGALGSFGYRLEVDGSTNKFNIKSGNGASVANRLSVERDTGNISFYEDTGTTAKFFWDASAEKLNLTGVGGLDVTGTATLDGLDIEGAGAGLANFYRASANANFSAITFKDTTNTNINAKIGWNANELRLDGTNSVRLVTDAKNRLLVSLGGDISFYEDTGTTPKLFWDASAEQLNINSAENNYAQVITQSNANGSAGGLYIQKTAGGSRGLLVDTTGSYASATAAFLGHSVGIGTSSPSAPLSVMAETVASVPVAGASSSHFAVGKNNQYGTMIGSLGSGIGYIQQQRFDGNAITYDLALQPNGGNVGIGTTAALGKVHIETQPSGAGITPSSNGDELVLENNSNCGLTIGTENLASIFFGKAADSDIGGIGYLMSDNSMRFTTNAAERMRIDSAGNVLVGKTTTAFNTKGMQIDGSNGNFSITATGATTAFFNRTSTDGSIVSFYKDGTTVGSIGTVGVASDLYIASNTFGARFLDSDTAFIPTLPSGGTGGTGDLGSSAYNWRDLYLSGGVYLGGTGAANLLDDYEAGAWTPTVGGTWTTSPTTLLGTYIKVGSLVYVKVQFLGGEKSSAVAGWIDGLPFNQAGGGATGSVSDAGVGDKGNCLFANTTRIWLTATSFSGTTYLSGCYNTDA